MSEPLEDLLPESGGSIIKVLDANGVKILFDLLSLQDYPNNDVLMAVINAIDTTKANKEDLAIEIPLSDVSITITNGQCQEIITNLKFIEGDYYSVVWDNITYTLIPCVNWEDEYNGIGSMWGADYSEYPFGFTAGYGDNNFGVYADEDGEHTFSIYHYTKLLPQADWEETDETSLAYIKNKPSLLSATFNLLNDYPETTTNGSHWGLPYETFFTDVQNALNSGMRIQFYWGLEEFDLHLPNGGIYYEGGLADLNLRGFEEDSYIILEQEVVKTDIYNMLVWITPDDIYIQYELKLDVNSINEHISDTTVHLTDEERAIWNAKMNGDKIFIGTKAEYNTAYAAGEIPVGALVVLTDVN